MTWINQPEIDQVEFAKIFKKKMAASSILKIPGAHDPMAALVAKQVGFETLYLSGAAYTASRGLPDLGIINSEELASRARDIVRATNLPLLVDIDTGFGGILNVARTAKEMEEARVAAVQIEDQDLPKKCGHLNGKKLITAEEMAQKINMIKEIAPNLIVVARTDARAVEGMESTLNRINQYIEAGADAIFPEAITDKDEFQQISKLIDVPLLANMTEFGKTPYYTAEEFQAFGYDMVIYPVSSLRVAAKAYQSVFQDIFDKGTQKDMLDDMQTREELYNMIHYYEYENLDQEISKTVLPTIKNK
ncbi:methylisocitrate lyase [Aquibacillus sediminis]|uniref:methylisocitrate lyase n=1 Tax=Aquibacillus sediminis TaxID=2574734 RepID=UPI001108CFC3|nr:methylisocitrate lyase [Aquibacillus sediminis]